MSDVRRVVISDRCSGERLDRALTILFPGITRSRFQQWIDGGYVRVNGAAAKKRDKLKLGDVVEVFEPDSPVQSDRGEEIPLDIVFEDEQLLVINKPPGLVVHPGAGKPDGTLLNALLHHDPRFGELPRAGIVHRLDKDTSGLLVVARTETARQHLISQLQRRSMGRDYVAIVQGVMISGGSIDAPIGRNRVDRKRMAVTGAGKEAVSHYRVLKRYRSHTLVHVTLESGRTHQIRVHMAHLKFPVLGDPVYGGKLHMPKGAGSRLITALTQFRRQALHAFKLRLEHPSTSDEMQWSVSVPSDMGELMEALTDDANSGITD